MQHEARKWLEDIGQAADLIHQFTHSHSFAEAVTYLISSF